jgi:hypothetical protein
MAKYLDDSGVQKLWNKCKSTFVRSVNNTTPDANGNVNVSGGGGTTKYIHNIIIGKNSSTYATIAFQLKNTTPTSYTTIQQVRTAINAAGYNSYSKVLIANGYIGGTYIIGIAVADPNGNNTQYRYAGANTQTNTNYTSTTSWTVFQDFVVED